jgi:hypothetical protein
MRRVVLGGNRRITKKRRPFCLARDASSLDPVPAQHERACVIDALRKSIRLQKVEKEAVQLLHKTGNNPTAGSPITAERVSSSDGRCRNLSVLHR